MEIKIRHAEYDDYECLHHLHAMPKAIEGTLQLPFPSKEMWKERISDKPENLYALVAEVDKKIIGSIAVEIVAKSPRRRHCAHLGMAVHDDYHGQGIGSKLVESGIDICENWLNVHRIELTVFTDNHAAIKLYKKYDFEVEGTLKDYAFTNGRYQSVYAMARIRKHSV